jgi:hypothetical protein
MPSGEHESDMTETTNQRIKNILRKRAKEGDAAEQEKRQAEERINEQKTTADRVRRKWSADTKIMAEILTDFEQKMLPLGLKLMFEDEGQKGDSIAGGRIFGHVTEQELQVTLTVDPTGEVRAFQGPKAGHIAVQFASPSKLSVLTADRVQYESLILDFIERDAGSK